MNKKLTVVKNNNTMVNFCESKRIICKSDVKNIKNANVLVHFLHKNMIVIERKSILTK